MDNDWSEWRQHILKELERLNEIQGSVNDKLDVLRVEVARLEVKGKFAQMIAGALGGAFISGLVTLLTKKL